MGKKVSKEVGETFVLRVIPTGQLRRVFAKNPSSSPPFFVVVVVLLLLCVVLLFFLVVAAAALVLLLLDHYNNTSRFVEKELTIT